MTNGLRRRLARAKPPSRNAIAVKSGRILGPDPEAVNTAIELRLGEKALISSRDGGVV